MRVGISLTDLSGEHHAELLLKSIESKIRQQGEQLVTFGLGSMRLHEFGTELFEDIAMFSSIGIGSGLSSLFRLMCKRKTTPTGILRAFTRYLLNRNPDVVLLVDSRALNVRLASSLRKEGYKGKIVYYIAPVRWESCFDASFFSDPKNLKRFADMKDLIDHFILIYPVSLDAYKKLDLPFTYIGHPMIELINNALSKADLVDSTRADTPLPADKQWVGVFAGSRRDEFKRMMPTLIKAINELDLQYRDLHYVFTVAQNEYLPQLRNAISFSGLTNKCTILDSTHTPDVVVNSRALIAKSGTVLHLAALACTPAVMVYEVSRVQAWLAQNLLNFRFPFYGLPNLILNQAVVPELIGGKFNPHRISVELSHLLYESDERARMIQALNEVRAKLICDNSLVTAVNIILELVNKQPACES